MLLYVRRRLYIIGGILFIAAWYFLTFLYSLICTSIYISGTLGYLYWCTRKEVSYQLGLVRTRRKARQVSTESHNQIKNFESNHINSFNESCNNSCTAWESKLSDVTHRNVQTAAGPLLTNNFAKAKDLIDAASKENKYRFNSSRFKAPALSNAERMTVTAKRRYPVSQEKYSLIGQLPIVQLKKEPLPFLKNVNTTMIHNPVTVKISPPEDYQRSSSRWKYVYPSSEKNKLRNDPCDARTVIAALKENRKRTSKDDVALKSVNAKRQRHDSNSSSGSAFMPTTSSPAVGNIESSSLNIQKCPNSTNMLVSSTSRNKRSRNNAIASSYSSSKRLREKLDDSLIQHLAKRKATVIDTSTPIKFIKVSERNENVPEKKAQDAKNSESDQSMETDKVEEVHEASSNASSPASLKKGVSYRKNLSVYTSLGSPIQAAPMPAHLPTLEEHEKDKKIEARRLEWLLSAVNEAFQSKNGATTAGEGITSISSSGSSTITTFPNINPNGNLNKTLPVCVSDASVTSSMDLFSKVANSSLTSFGPLVAATTSSPALAVTQASFLSSQASTVVTSNETVTNVKSSLFPSTNFSYGSQNEKVTSVDSIFSALSGTSSNASSITLPQASLSSSTVTTTSISLPLSSSIVKPSKENYSLSFPSSVAASTTTASSKEMCESNVVTSNSSVSSGLTTLSGLPVANTDSLTKSATTLSGGFTFNLQPSSFAFSSSGSQSTGQSGGFNFPFTTESNAAAQLNVGNKSEVVSASATTASPLSVALTSSNNIFQVTTSFAMAPSSGLVTNVASTTTSQSLFPLGTSTKPFMFGSTNEQGQSLFGAAVQPQTELTTSQNEKTSFETFNSQVPLVPPSIVTAASSNQAASNSFLSPSAMISPNQNPSLFGTSSQNAFASNVTNPFGTNNQATGFGQSQTFANPNTAISQNQAPTFGSNQGTFVSGSTSQSAFMTSGQMQPVLGTTNAFNVSTNMQTFGNAAAPSTPFQFGANTGNFNFNFVAPTYSPLPSFGTPTPAPTGNTLFSIGSGKLDRKASSSRRRLVKK